MVTIIVAVVNIIAVTIAVYDEINYSSNDLKTMQLCGIRDIFPRAVITIFSGVLCQSQLFCL